MGRCSSIRLLWVARLAPALALFAGCTAHNFEAKSLPIQYAAQPMVDISELDMSMLAAPAYGSQQIFPGDTLNVTVVSGADGDAEVWPVRVLDDGSVQLPMIGRMVVAGQDLQVAQSLIRDASIQRGVFRSPSVSLSIDERRTHRISVVGAVVEPGSYDLPAGNADLLAAIMAAGGLAEDADAIIEVRHAVSAVTPSISIPETSGGYVAQTSAMREGGMLSSPGGFQGGFPGGFQGGSALAPPGSRTQIDLIAATRQGGMNPIRLRDGDVVTVKRRPAQHIQVLGLVNRADRFELKPGQPTRVLDSIAMAGGLSIDFADRVLVVRRSPDSPEPVTIHVSLRQAKQNPNVNLILRDGDVVSVEETPVTFVFGTLLQTVRLAINGSVSAF